MYLLITEIDDVIDSDIFLIPNNVLVSESLEVIDSDNPLSDCNTLVIEILDVIEIAIALLAKNCLITVGVEVISSVSDLTEWYNLVVLSAVVIPSAIFLISWPNTDIAIVTDTALDNARFKIALRIIVSTLVILSARFLYKSIDLATLSETILPCWNTALWNTSNWNIAPAGSISDLNTVLNLKIVSEVVAESTKLLTDKYFLIKASADETTSDIVRWDINFLIREGVILTNTERFLSDV